MNPEEAIFEIAYRAGVGHYEISLDDALNETERRESLSSAAFRFEEALTSGHAPDVEDEFDCRTRLAIVLVHLNYKGNADISQNGLSDGLKKALEQLERALTLDARAGGKFLIDRRVAATILLQLDTLWLSQSSYTYKRFGAVTALKYLEDKLKLLKHLGGVNLPGLCAMLFQYSTETGSPGIGEDWLRRAAKGETYEDVARGTRFYSASSQYKQKAQQMLSQWEA